MQSHCQVQFCSQLLVSDWLNVSCIKSWNFNDSVILRLQKGGRPSAGCSHMSGVWGRDKPRQVFPPQNPRRGFFEPTTWWLSETALTTAPGLPFSDSTITLKKNMALGISLKFNCLPNLRSQDSGHEVYNHLSTAVSWCHFCQYWSTITMLSNTLHHNNIFCTEILLGHMGITMQIFTGFY